MKPTPDPQAAIDGRLNALMVASQDRNDRDSYAELLRTCEPIIRNVARRGGLTDDRLNDVVQETLLTIHHARHTYDPSRSFMAWLTVLAKRRTIDVLRKTGRSSRREVHAPVAYDNHADPQGTAAYDWERSSHAKILAAAIAVLPDGQREAVERLALREQSLAEAAADTGKSIVALKVNLHRALGSLRKRLGSSRQGL